MAQADKYFIEQVNAIKNGSSDIGQKIRTLWPDGAPAHTYKTFAFTTEYNLADEFPILTLRKQAFKNTVKEVLWIFQKKSNNVNDLGLHIWDSWASEDGSIGKTYGYCAGEKFQYPEGFMDQVDNVRWSLKNRPMDRRMIIQLFRPEYITQASLPPCVMTYMFDVADGKLNMYVLQRSADMLAAGGAGGWDEVSAAILQYMFAADAGLEVGKLTHTCINLHIYDRHMPIVDEIINNVEYDAPKIWINPEVKDFYKFTVDDFKLIDYKSTKYAGKIEVAI